MIAVRGFKDEHRTLATALEVLRVGGPGCDQSGRLAPIGPRVAAPHMAAAKIVPRSVVVNHSGLNAIPMGLLPTVMGFPVTVLVVVLITDTESSLEFVT